MFKTYKSRFGGDEVRIVGDKVIPAGEHNGDIHEDVQPCITIPTFDETLKSEGYIYSSSPFWGDADEVRGHDRSWAYEVMGGRKKIEETLKRLYEKEGNTMKERELEKDLEKISVKYKRKVTAILSTTIIPVDGTYSIDTLTTKELKKFQIEGAPHFIGHPDTKSIVESLGAVPAPSKLFTGLEPGEIALCFPIQQGKSSRITEGHTNPHQAVSMEDLEVRMIQRVDGCPL